MQKSNRIKNFFDGLEFEESLHKYSFDGKPVSISVSGIVDRFVRPFNIQEKSLKKARELGISQQEVLKMWRDKGDSRCKLGKNIHLFAEERTFKNIKPSNKYEEAVVKFWKAVPKKIFPMLTELKMYHKKYLFAGTCDTLLYNNETGRFVITDWKTNEDLFKNFTGERLLGCFSDLLKNNFNKYQIQLSLYQILFEQTGYKVEDRRIIHLKPDGTFSIYKTEDYTQRLKDYLETEYNKINYESQ